MKWSNIWVVHFFIGVSIFHSDCMSYFNERRLRKWFIFQGVILRTNAKQRPTWRKIKYLFGLLVIKCVVQWMTEAVGTGQWQFLIHFFKISGQLLLQEKNVQISEPAMTDTLRGNNRLMPSRASNPNLRIKRESSTEKIHSNYGIWFFRAEGTKNKKNWDIIFYSRFLLSFREHHTLQSSGNVDNFTRSTC